MTFQDLWVEEEAQETQQLDVKCLKSLKDQYQNVKITAQILDDIKSLIKTSHPEFKWCQTRTKKQLLEETREGVLWSLVGGSLRDKSLIYSFNIQKKIINNISVKNKRLEFGKDEEGD